MDVLDAFLLGSLAFPVIETFPVWAPVVLAGLAFLAWRELRPSGRHRGRRQPLRTVVRAGVRTTPDNSPAAAAETALNCADTSPDMTADNRPDTPGHDGAGAH